MLEAVKVALDPSPSQARALASNAGAARFVHNAALAHVKEQLEVRERLAATGVPAEELPDVPWNFYALRRWWTSVREETAPWYRENTKEAYDTGLEALGRGLSNFTASRKGKRKGVQVGFPTFKTRTGSRPTFRITKHHKVTDTHGVHIPRVGRIHTHERVDTRIPAGAKISRVTLSQTGGRWFAALTIEHPGKPAVRRDRGRTVGVDLGIRTLATLSTGEVVPPPTHLAGAQKRLARQQRHLARTQKGSNGRKAAAAQVARTHARVSSLRQDALHKLTTRLVTEFDHVVIEDLNVKGMAATPKPKPDPEKPGTFLRNGRAAKRGFNRQLADASFGEFRRQLEYKSLKFGAVLTVADRWYPSSKTCTNCRAVKAKLSRSAHLYRCESCGAVIDRDLNAARNLRALVAGGGPETQNGSRGGIRLDSGRAAPEDVATTPRTRGSDVDRPPATAARLSTVKTGLSHENQSHLG